MNGQTATTEAAKKDFGSLYNTWTLAEAAEENTKKRCLMLGLAAEARSRASQAALNIETASKTYKQAVAAIHQHKVRLRAIHEATKLQITEGKTPGTSPSSANHAAILFKLVQSNTQACKMSTGGDSDSFNGNKPKFSQLKNIKLTTLANIHKGFATTTLSIASATGGCPNAQAVTDIQSRLAGCQIAAATTTTYAFSTLKATSDKGQIKADIFDAATENSDCHKTIRNLLENAGPEAKLQKAICDGLKTKQPVVQPLRRSSGDSLAALHSIQLFIRNCDADLQSNADAHSGPQAEKLKRYIKEAYKKHTYRI
uniref:Variant surface glycoprotein 1125.5411 n=1 Tax=Trypanosoma brucei TaxID=5691 RepID=A0A1J0RCA0_9TRYP|nr:variant surface glycoprotein 1125.5411 [Trypanosoma brucei]